MKDNWADAEICRKKIQKLGKFCVIYGITIEDLHRIASEKKLDENEYLKDIRIGRKKS